jgi:hypothetical protein
MLLRAMFKWLLLASLCVLAVPAAAQEDEEPNTLQKLLGAAGVLELPKAPIDYEERSPLVVPPSSELPPPSNVGDASKLNPEWPNDPDWNQVRQKTAKRRISEEERRGNFYPDGGFVKVEDMSRVNPVRPKKNPDPTGGYTTAGEEAKNGTERYSPSQLGFLGWGKKDSTTFKGEPDRALLTDPPPGYRVPSPNAPYGVVEEKSKSTLSSPLDRLNNPDEKH